MKYPEILAISPEPAEFHYDADDTILYALGLGAGARPDELQFVYEKNLRALPTSAVMMGGGSGDFIAQGGIDYTRIVHGEQRLTIHQPLPPAGRILSKSRLLGVVDKGKEKGALVLVESTASDAASGALFATAVSTLFCRGDGGFGGPSDGDLPLHAIPERPHDLGHIRIGLVQDFVELPFRLHPPVPRILERCYLCFARFTFGRRKEDVVVAVTVEGRIKVDQVYRFIWE